MARRDNFSLPHSAVSTGAEFPALLKLRVGYWCVPFVSHQHLVEARKAVYYLALCR
jgi:hypothetical protein